MWECEGCGTTGIAADLTFCPHCYQDRPGLEVPAEDVPAESKGEAGAESAPSGESADSAGASGKAVREGK